MLHDPKWEQKTKADPLTLEALIAWLEKQNPKKRYDFCCVNGGCLVGLYYLDVFGKDFFERVDRPLFTDVFGGDKDFNLEAYVIAATQPYTMSAALKRARAVSSSD